MSSICRSGKALSPMTAAKTDRIEVSWPRQSRLYAHLTADQNRKAWMCVRSVAAVASLSAADGLVDDVPSHHDQLATFVLA
jgi:hypothetical protein